MDFLISFYDNALIYYPNVFFAALFFVSILGILLVSMGRIFLWKKIKRVIEEIKSNLKQIKRIKIKERKAISFAQMIRAFFLTKSVSLFYTVKTLTVFFVRIVRIFFIRINTALEYIESQAERIIKRIGKEVLIEE